MNFRFYYLVMLAILLFAEGCAFSRGTLGDEIAVATIESIKKGESKADVLAKIGAPDRLIQVNGRDVLQYYHYDAKAGSLLLILVNFSRLQIKSDDLFVILNQDGLVEDIISSKRTDTLEFRFWPFGE